MFTKNLFQTVLIEPAEQSADTLYIVSGYAGATMVFRHLQALKKVGKDIRLELIVGMTGQDGLSSKDHEGFQQLASGPYKDLFVCRYVAYRPPVHSKMYAWFSGNLPKTAFSGSANYTQAAFNITRRENMVEHDAQDARLYFDLVRQDTVDCFDPHIANLITIYHEPAYSISRKPENGEGEEEEEEGAGVITDHLAQLPLVRISLLDNQGRLPRRSGLNWGQRAEYNRDPSQAYIRIPMGVARTDFFPSLGDYFTLLTDDDKTLICVRAQAGAKAIHTPQDNSILGTYFRYRLGMPEGSLITEADLQRYGRTDATFYKIDEETYYMDFSV